MRSAGEILRSASPRKPFSNGTEWEAWSSGWCDHPCALEQDCTILDVIILYGVTPDELVSKNFGALGPERYSCTEFTEFTETSPHVEQENVRS